MCDSPKVKFSEPVWINRARIFARAFRNGLTPAVVGQKPMKREETIPQSIDQKWTDPLEQMLDVIMDIWHGGAEEETKARPIEPQPVAVECSDCGAKQWYLG